ncbi:MAG: carbonate dehydratase [Chitinophagales bacterium]|nr:carbonate dehydratase [Chitinophagaceae bacterium]MBP9881776.1 carbonate dehydratase [Chitinophagales bacterium]
MHPLQNLLEKNKSWAATMRSTQPDFFLKLSLQQSPEYLWIGCSDSRVPANEIVGLLPGELFVHRNVANVVVHTDFNCLSVIEYAVERLQVKHIIVCGHYGCGGVQAALKDNQLGLIDNWLRHIKEVWKKYEKEISLIEDEHRQLDRLCELNVIEQVVNVCNTTIIQKAWKRGQQVDVHGWIYSIQDGQLRDLNVQLSNSKDIETFYEAERTTK